MFAIVVFAILAAGIIYEGKDVAQTFSMLAFFAGLFLFTPRKEAIDEDNAGCALTFLILSAIFAYFYSR